MGFSVSYWQSEGFRQLTEWEVSQDHRILMLEGTPGLVVQAAILLS